MLALGLTLPTFTAPGDSTPGGADSALLLCDGTSGLLLCDGISFLLLAQ